MFRLLILGLVAIGSYFPAASSSGDAIAAAGMGRVLYFSEHPSGLAEINASNSTRSTPDELCRASILAFLTCSHEEAVARLPAVNSLMGADARPAIGLALLKGSMDPAGWSLSLDGNDITTQSESTNTGIAFMPAEPLFEGNHIVRVEHGAQVWEWGFRTSTPPFITRIGLDSGGQSSAPNMGRRPVLRVEYGDEHAGIDASSLRLLLNGKDVTDLVKLDLEGLEFTPSYDFEDGSYVVLFSVSDMAGNFTYAPYFFDVGEIRSVEFRSSDE